jgi:hypothetical protein
MCYGIPSHFVAIPSQFPLIVYQRHVHHGSFGTPPIPAEGGQPRRKPEVTILGSYVRGDFQNVKKHVTLSRTTIPPPNRTQETCEVPMLLL